MKDNSSMIIKNSRIKYVFSALITVILAALSAIFEREFGLGFGFLLFNASVLFSIYIGGLRTGIFSSTLFLLYFVYRLFSKQFTFDYIHQIQLGQIILLGFEGIFMSILLGTKNKVNEKLLESERQKKAILNSAPQALITIDDKGTIVDFNPAAEKIFGLTSKKMLHKKFEDLILPTSFRKTYKKKFVDLLIDSQDSILGKPIEIATYHADRTSLPIEMTIVPTNNSDNIFYTAYIRDITAQKRQEEENAQIIEREQKALEKAKEAILARDEFLSIASHELKTPLTSMLLQLQTVLHNIRNVSLANFSVENLLKMLEGSEKQTNRLSRMINDLLNVSLITTGKLELEREEFDLVELTKEILDRFSSRIEREKYKVVFHAKEPVVGNWDKLRIEQVISNLVSNAMKYGNNKPISITVEKKGEYAIFAIQDQGIGIPKDQQEKIFERFKRGVSSRDYKGLGVGLYITNQIIQTHGGSIRVESQPGNGSLFIAQLPIKPHNLSK